MLSTYMSNISIDTHLLKFGFSFGVSDRFYTNDEST